MIPSAPEFQTILGPFVVAVVVVGAGVGLVDAPGVGLVDAPGVGVVEAPGVGVVDAPGVGVVSAPGVGVVSEAWTAPGSLNPVRTATDMISSAVKTVILKMDFFIKIPPIPRHLICR